MLFNSYCICPMPLVLLLRRGGKARPYLLLLRQLLHIYTCTFQDHSAKQINEFLELSFAI